MQAPLSVGRRTILLNAALAAAFILTAAPSEAATINGTVRKLTDSTALAGAKVYRLAAGARADSATTDALGAYTLIDAPTGFGQQVVAELAGYATSTLTVNLFQETSTATANFYLGAPGSISGTVRRASDSAIVGGAMVYLRRSSSTSTILDSTVADSFGAYAFNNQAPGSPNYWITASSAGYVATTNSNVALGSGGTVVSDVYLLTLGGIAVQVRKLSDSTAIANASVVLRRGNSDTAAIIDSGLTDSFGNIAFPNLTATSGGGGGSSTQYRVYASAAGMVGAANTGLSVSNGTTLTTSLYLGAAASVSGTVRKASDNTVLVGASVYLRRSSATSTILDSAVTDALGQYAFAGVAPGSPNYWISASFPDLATATNADVVVGSGAAVVSNLSLDPILPGSISGTVRKAADSTLVAGAKVFLRRTSSNSEILDSAVADGLGAFAFDSLEAGAPNYFVTASTAGFANATVSNIVVNNGANTTLTVYMTTLGGISGFVRRMSDSTAIANALVLLRRGTSDTSAILDSVRTDALGAYAFSGLTASSGGGGGASATRYRVYATAQGFATAINTNIQVSNGNTTTSNLYLGLPGTISGTVHKSADSTTLTGASVYLRRSSPTSTILDSTQTNSLGRYAFANLSPGAPNYWITASAPGYTTATNADVAVIANDTTASDFYLEIVVSIASERMMGNRRTFTARRLGNGWLIRLPAASTTRTFTIHDARGTILHRTSVPAGTTELTLPGTASQAGAIMRLE